MKISYKLTLVFAGISILIVLIIGLIGYQTGSSIILSDINKYQFKETKTLIASIDQTIHYYHDDILKLSENPVVKAKESKSADYQKEFLIYKEQSGYLAFAFFNLDRQPKVLLDEKSLIRQEDIGHVWENALLGKSNTGEYIRFEETLKIPIAYFVFPVNDNLGKPIGVIIVVSGLNAINTQINNLSEAEGKFITLIDSEKNVIFSSDPIYKEKLLRVKLTDSKAVNEVLSGKEGTMEEYFAEHKETEIVSYVKEVGFEDFTGNNWFLIAMSDKDKLLAPIDSFRNQMIGFGALTFILAILAGVIISRGITGSLAKIVAVAEKIAAGDIKQRVGIKSKDEIGFLAGVINQMLDSIGKSQADLKEQRNQIQAIISSMGEGVLVVDKDQNIFLMNSQAEKLLDIKLTAVKGKKWDQFWSIYKGDKELDYSLRPVARALTTGKPVFIKLEDDYYYLTKSGKKFPVTIAATSLLGNGVTGGVVVFRDVTEEKGVQQKIENEVVVRTKQLSEEKIKLSASISSLAVGFVMTDIQNNIVTINQSARNILCASSSSPLATVKDCTLPHIENELKGAIDLRALIVKCTTEKKPILIKELMLQNRYLKLFLSPIIEDQLVLGTVILVEDITEAKLLERSRDEFFSIASHELRTPLTAIKGNTSMLLDYFAGELKDPQMKEMIDDVHESSIRLIEIVNDFLDTSRLELGKMEFKKDILDLPQLIPSTIKEYQVTSSRKKLYIHFEDIGKAPSVVGDKDRFKQVLINLIGNGLKFTQKGGVTVSLKIEGTFVKVRVSDTGMGIPEDNQKLLFRKFQQAESNILTRDVIKGTGLGLYISRMMVEGMGGTIKLESSAVGKGTTFSFTLPVATKADIAAAKVATTKIQADFHAGPAMNTNKSNIHINQVKKSK